MQCRRMLLALGRAFLGCQHAMRPDLVQPSLPLLPGTWQSWAKHAFERRASCQVCLHSTSSLAPFPTHGPWGSAAKAMAVPALSWTIVLLHNVSAKCWEQR